MCISEIHIHWKILHGHWKTNRLCCNGHVIWFWHSVHYNTLQCNSFIFIWTISFTLALASVQVVVWRDTQAQLYWFYHPTIMCFLNVFLLFKLIDCASFHPRFNLTQVSSEVGTIKVRKTERVIERASQSHYYLLTSNSQWTYDWYRLMYTHRSPDWCFGNPHEDRNTLRLVNGEWWVTWLMNYRIFSH